ncbi:hypothetical protein HDU76_012513 [Blyttiomyces sp. JEL0837]|nr:hypothetical protein HDU76_012513 [Blyttiomyces sp. JEL0837]
MATTSREAVEIDHQHADQLKELIEKLDDHTFNFQKQISNWIGLQENPTNPGSGIEDDRTEKLDIRGLLLSQPKNMEAELGFHKELFSKLKFNFLEQTTKETFLKRVLAVPPQWCTPDDLKEAEAKNEELKVRLKAFKAETEEAKESLRELVDQVCDGNEAGRFFKLTAATNIKPYHIEHSKLIQSRNEAEELAKELVTMERDLEYYQSMANDDLQTTDELKSILEEQNGPIERLNAELEGWKLKLEEEQNRNTELKARLAELEATKDRAQTAATEAERSLSLRDPREDEYMRWYEHWTEKLMDLQGVRDLKAISENQLEVTYVIAEGKTTTVSLSVNTDENPSKPNLTLKSLDSTCNCDDIIEFFNENLDEGLITLSEAIPMALGEVVRRLRCYEARQAEFEEVAGQSGNNKPWTFKSDPGSDKVVIGVNSTGRSVVVRVDTDYPMHSDCFDVISIFPDGKVVDVVNLQKLIDEQKPTSVTGLINIVVAF